jgi:hypothetical protein
LRAFRIVDGGGAPVVVRLEQPQSPPQGSFPFRERAQRHAKIVAVPATMVRAVISCVPMTTPT